MFLNTDIKFAMVTMREERKLSSGKSACREEVLGEGITGFSVSQMLIVESTKEIYTTICIIL